MAEEYLTDDEQWEAFKRWFAENGLWLVAGVVIGASLLFGYRYYESQRNDRALRASMRFDQMTTALEAGQVQKSREIADSLVKDFPASPYADQARLTIARLFVDEGRDASALPPLLEVMKESKDKELRKVARLRVARLQIDEGKADDALKTLAEDEPGAFAAKYHEIRGDAYYAKKDVKNAVAEYQSALTAGVGGGVDTALLELKIADLSNKAAS